MLLQGYMYYTLSSLCILYTYVHTYIYTYIHTCIHTYIHMNIHTYIHTNIHTVHTHVCTYVHTYTHTVHTYVHTYIHTYIHKYTCSCCAGEQFKHLHTYVGTNLQPNSRLLSMTLASCGCSGRWTMSLPRGVS